MEVAILKYNAGNTQSMIYALKRLGIEPLLSDDPETIRKADKVIFPGVGEASSTMRHFRETGLDRLLPTLEQPVLGVCLGLQLMCRYSEEGNTHGMGIFEVDVKKFEEVDGLKIPHMGWNTLDKMQQPLFSGFAAESHVYFVHSYYAEMSSSTSSVCNYGVEFSSSLHKDNFYAVQFHPEKSGETGALLLKNFIEL